jgi:hypothetical protein
MKRPPPPRLLVALQYHAGDAPGAFSLLRLLADIQRQSPLAPDWDLLCWIDSEAPDVPADIVAAFGALGLAANYLRAPACPQGWPAGPNAMWASLARILAEDPTIAPRCTHVFTAEPDGVPMNLEWAHELLTAHLAREILHGVEITGHYLENPVPHINGNLIMRRDVARRFPELAEPVKKAWDIHHARLILDHSADNPAITSDYRCGRRDTLKIWSQEKADTTPAWLHGPGGFAAHTEARRRLCPGQQPEIPRDLHQIWIGPDPIPEHCARWVNLWHTIHGPEIGWRHQLHGNELLKRWPDDPVLREQLALGVPWAFVADRLRCLLLAEDGGAYVDVDVQPIAPLEGVLRTFEGAGFICARLADDEVPDVGVLFSAPGDPVARRLVEDVTEPHRTGHNMLAVLDNCPGVTYAPTEWWFANDVRNAVYAFGEGHHLRTWQSPAAAAVERPHRFALLACVDHNWSIRATADDRNCLKRALDELVATRQAPIAGIWRLSRASAERWKESK